MIIKCNIKNRFLFPRTTHNILRDFENRAPGSWKVLSVGKMKRLSADRTSAGREQKAGARLGASGLLFKLLTPDNAPCALVSAARMTRRLHAARLDDAGLKTSWSAAVGEVA
ncbi:hypothetical protein NDU88_006338 [Pleurodeles waltl]|uniref:Uncharacterized protein n=1 Tax=Pleurodeles waltl TaxID=8319 RepID=A0AAV7QHA8_PLEWA|nr:hypothetical protein NDU88_006338 [Pleurodeles waltl]